MNIYDIAEKCGVSIATVSRVLNNNPNVSAATRAKIQAVIDEANYTPSALARSLGTGTEPVAAPAGFRAVGVLCSDIRDPFYADVLANLEQELGQRGLPMLLASTGDTPEQEQAALQTMLSSGVIALLYVGPHHHDGASPLPAIAGQVPVILLDGYVDAPGIYGVTGDYPSAVAELVEQLMRRQRRRILFLYSRMTHGCQQKIQGYRDAYAAAGLTVDPALMVSVDPRLEDVNACIKKLLVNRVTFDAIIGTEDMLALGAQKTLQRTGLSMPVVGFHNSLAARCATPELSSVSCDPAGMCAAAMQVLDDLLAGRQPHPHTQLPTQLVERDTFRNA